MWIYFKRIMLWTPLYLVRDVQICVKPSLQVEPKFMGYLWLHSLNSAFGVACVFQLLHKHQVLRKINKLVIPLWLHNFIYTYLHSEDNFQLVQFNVRFVKQILPVPIILWMISIVYSILFDSFFFFLIFVRTSAKYLQITHQ